MIFTKTWFKKNGSHPSKEVSRLSICADPNKYRYYERESDPNETKEYESYQDLANMIQQCPGKISEIYSDGVQEESPEYLTLLVAMLHKTDSLTVDVLGGDAAYGYLMGSMLQQNGLRELSFFNPIMSTLQARLLFEGIASSRTLEKLNLSGNFEEPEEAGTALASALRRNYSLKTLHLFIKLADGGTALKDLFKAAANRIDDFYMSAMEGGHQQLSFDFMAETLCTDKCTVKTLDISACEPPERAQSALSDEYLDTLQNMSVTRYNVEETSLDCSRIMETAGLFRSIKVLSLIGNKISDLSPLDPLLIGDNVTLETLDLMGNEIREKDAIEFFQKIPEMTCLRKLGLTANPFQDYKSWKGVLAGVARHNRSLECINCVYDDYPNDIPEYNVPLSLNRGGRRALEIESSTPLPAKLWPHVLERAGKISYFGPDDSWWSNPGLESTRPDVVFWLLREKLVGSALHG